MNLKAVRHIIWDWNGTLVDDAQRCVDIMNGIRSKRSMPLISLEEYRDLFDFPVIEYYKKIGFDLEKHPFEVLSEEFISGYIASRKNLPLQEGAMEALSYFRERELPQCVLSATQSESLHQTLREHNIDHFFKTVLGLDHHYADGKTHLGEQWLKLNHINKEHVLFIGDTLHDMEVADTMGVQCLLISQGHHSEERLKKTSTTTLENLNQLIELFKIRK